MHQFFDEEMYVSGSFYEGCVNSGSGDSPWWYWVGWSLFCMSLRLNCCRNLVNWWWWREFVICPFGDFFVCVFHVDSFVSLGHC